MKIRNVFHSLLAIVGILIFLFAGFFMDAKETFPDAAQELKEASNDTNLSDS